MYGIWEITNYLSQSMEVLFIPKFMPVFLLYGVVLFLVFSLLSANLLNGD
jgi:hypothetical protein